MKLRITNSWTHWYYITVLSIGAGTGPAGPAMAVPFSAEVETKVCVRLLLNYCSKFPAEYVRKCVRIRLTFSMAKLPGLPGECMKAPPDC